MDNFGHSTSLNLRRLLNRMDNQNVVIKEEMGLQQRIISHILIIHPIQQTTKVQTGGVTEIIHMVLKYISILQEMATL
jgi:hypothetical protein